MADDLLTIGELAARTGVTTSALRYYEELGLVRPATRDSGRRRYKLSAVERVGVVLLLQQVGFTLREVGRLVGTRTSTRVWRQLASQKLADLDRQITKAQAARHAIDHAIQCPHESILDCPTFGAFVGAVLEGKTLAEAHPG
jgi:MerR family redox-sensitive transcriptional activator SoxR